MNRAAIALYMIGILSIIGGVVIGFTTYEVPVEGYSLVTEEDYGILFTWIGAGVISGVMMFGFAEIVNQLTKQTQISNDIKLALLPQENTNEDPSDNLEAMDKEDVNKLREEYRSKGYGERAIDTIVGKGKE